MNLKELREQRGLTQSDVAKIIGVSQSHYSKYELEKAEPDITSLKKLADYFDITIDYLVDRPYSNKYEYLSEDEQEIINAFRLMNKVNKTKFLSEAKGILIAQK